MGYRRHAPRQRFAGEAGTVALHRGGYETALVPALRRVDRVCITVGPHGSRAEVRGIGRHWPVRVPVSMATARKLVAAGAPLHVTTEHHTHRAA